MLTVEALRKEVDRERLECLQQMLAVDSNDINPSIEKYDKLLNETFDMRKVAPFDVQEHLYSNKYFCMWQHDDDLPLIILQGTTEHPADTDLSWLSPGATHVIRNADGIFENTRLVLQHLCQPKYNCGGYKAAGRKILSSLIFQVLKSPLGTSLIRDNESYSRVKHDIELVNQLETDRPNEILKRLFGILGYMIGQTEAKRVLIVVDRLDVMGGDLETFIDPLLRLILDVKVKVKVMLTVCAPRCINSNRIRRELGANGYRILEIDQGD